MVELSNETTQQHYCANCDAALGGRFCQQCGQAAYVHRSLLHTAEELLHGIFHFETRAWRTLAELVWRPGRMIREYIDGRRTRYVAPLPLFLFMMFALFLVFSMTTTIGDTPEHGTAAAPSAAVSSGVANARLNDTRWLTAVMKGRRTLGAEEVHRELMNNVPWAAWPSFEHKILHAANNRELAIYKVKNGAAKFAILLVPLTLPLLWLLFIRRRDVQLFDHVVFSFYSLSSMALLLILLSLLEAIGLPMLGEVLKVLLPPVMFYMQLRGTYQLTRWGTLWRTAVLLLYALLAMGAYLLFVIMVSM